MEALEKEGAIVRRRNAWRDLSLSSDGHVWGNTLRLRRREGVVDYRLPIDKILLLLLLIVHREYLELL
jgi:hypothetical protein